MGRGRQAIAEGARVQPRRSQCEAAQTQRTIDLPFFARLEGVLRVALEDAANSGPQEDIGLALRARPNHVGRSGSFPGPLKKQRV